MTNENLQTRIVATCMTGFLIILAIIAIAGNHALHKQNQKLQKEVDYYQNNYRYKIGGTSLWNSHREWIDYKFCSLDSGRTWYAFHTTTNDQVIIDGPADTVYPGLMKSLNDWDNVVKYAEQHGPINPNNSEDLKILESNGFTVRRTAN